MIPQAEALLSDLDATLARASNARRSQMLRQMTDLLLAGAASYPQEMVSVFDTVMRRLSEKVEPKALAELSGRLASLDSAPADLVVQLSQSDDIAVSGPVLEKSNVLGDGALVGVAKTKSQGHLLAIAGRTRINDVVTDVLVDRGNPAVRCKVTANAGALFSERGFARLVTEARNDKNLAALVVKRNDLPPELQPFLKMAVA
jgi:uncharacterized protein (DUF2336 family)